MMTPHGRWIAVLLVAALPACAPVSFAPVSDQGANVRQPHSPTREVLAGDTLYSIAWESGRDYRELAVWNNIPPPYVIKPGQKLRLFPPAKSDGGESAPPRKSVARSHTVRRGETLYRIALNYDVEPKDLADWNRIEPPYHIKPGQTLRLSAPSSHSPAQTRTGKPDGGKTADVKRSARNKSAKNHAASSNEAAITATQPSALRTGGWIWPTDGPLLGRFSNGGAKGIDIGGKKGQPVRAAAQGEVVYQGGGLRGYGQLIIIKHNAEFLSAYAHCDRIYVREGDVIKRGQKIADMGNTGTDRTELHFEIRYRGAPVDPLHYLPRK